MVKLLGLYTDHLLNFHVHVENICRQAGRKVIVMDKLRKVEKNTNESSAL